MPRTGPPPGRRGQLREAWLSGPEGIHVAPENPCGTGVLVLAGSSGRIDAERARLLARHGAHALSIRWFGGEGQPSAPAEVPLETFTEALDLLARDCERLAVVGTSLGAEAALLTGGHDARVAAVVALAPSSVVWAGVVTDAAGTPRQTSHWTLAGTPLPFVPFLDSWSPAGDPPAYRELYELSLQADPVVSRAAAIPVERIAGEVVLVAGGDDQVWPSVDFAQAVAQRRATHGLGAEVVTHAEAGHRTVLPGEPVVTAGMAMARGGTPAADAELGDRAWPALATVLRLPTA